MEESIDAGVVPTFLKVRLDIKDRFLKIGDSTNPTVKYLSVVACKKKI